MEVKMFSKNWHTSRRQYDIVAERNVKIPVEDGITLNADIFRPAAKGKFPALVGMHPYPLQPQSAPIKPVAFSLRVGALEAGDPSFYVRRGYVQIIANVRGTGDSGGDVDWFGPREVRDIYDVIEWAAKQPWCDGKVSMFGPSYFAMVQNLVASLNPPSLKCLFAPWALTDLYRDMHYRGGIFNYSFVLHVSRGFLNPRWKRLSLQYLSDEQFKTAIDNAIHDQDIAAIPQLVEALQNPDQGTNIHTVDHIVNALDGSFWDDRRPKYDAIKVPAYLGACWGSYAQHLPGAFRSWESMPAALPKKLVIGPPMYLERPVYQMHYESLRWFDYWLKGMDTGIMDEPPVKLFIMGTNQWKEANEWPLPETKWTPFYLHENNLLSEHEFWPNEGPDSFEDSRYYRGSLEYNSPPMVEDTEVIGPIVLNLFASTSDDEVLWFISLREVDREGNERILTRGWLRGSHREVDPERSKPWAPFHPHTKCEPLTPGKIYEFNIPIIPTGNLFKAGSRFKLKISCADDEPTNTFEEIAGGNLQRQSASRITIYHDADHPSHLLLPVTKGNIIGTFITGGKPFIDSDQPYSRQGRGL
jgi:predicted acyl esterase